MPIVSWLIILLHRLALARLALSTSLGSKISFKQASYASYYVIKGTPLVVKVLSLLLLAR